MKNLSIRTSISSIILFVIICLLTNLDSQAQWNMRVVTYSGQPAPGTDNAIFSNGFYPFNSMFLTNNGTVLFTSNLESGIGDGGGWTDKGIWIEKGGELDMFVRKDKKIPNSDEKFFTIGEYESFRLICDQRTDKTILAGTFSNDGVDFKEGFVTSDDDWFLSLHELEGQTLYPNTSIRSVRIEGFNNGIVLINGSLEEDVDDHKSWNNGFIASYYPELSGNYSLVPIARGGEPMVGAPGQIYRYGTGRGTPIDYLGGPDENGRAVVYAIGNDADYLDDQVRDDNIYTLYESDPNGNLSVIKTMMQGEQKWVAAHATFNSTGEIAFIGLLDEYENFSDKSLWVGKEMDRVVATYGDVLPGTIEGENLAGILEWTLTDDGRVVFLGTMEGSGSGSFKKQGIWMEDGNKQLKMIARRGVPLPGSKIISEFDIFHYACNPGGTIAFRVWGLDENNNDVQEIWIGDTDGLDLVVSSGDQVEIEAGDVRNVGALSMSYYWAINSLGWNKYQYSGVLNNNNDLLIDVEFTDGTYAVVVASSGFVVNSTDNDVDKNPGDGKCECEGPEIEGRPKCTLRAAIMEANASEKRDKILFDIPTDDPGYNFETGTYTIWPNGSSLNEITMPVVIDGTSQDGFENSPIIVLDGTDLGINASYGFGISGGNCDIRGFVITNFIDDAHGIHMFSKGDNIIRGNYIGVDHTGSGPAGMGSNGVFIDNIPDNLIGGKTEADRNIISNNDPNGGTRGCNVRIEGVNARNNSVSGNYIGTDVTGTKVLANTVGVCINDAPGNTIGGTVENMRNLITGNTYGIRIMGKASEGNKVQGNYIGTKADGLEPSLNKNDFGGIQIIDAPGNLIGGESDVPGSAPGNLISGIFRDHRSSGIEISGPDAKGNIIQGNIIGLDHPGKKEIGNGVGVSIRNGNNTKIGGANKKTRNIISGNKNDGIVMENVAETMVLNNFIGTDIDGQNPIGNGTNGVRISNARDNTIGGDIGVSGNLISGNSENGIFIKDDAGGNIIQGNLIGTDLNGQLVNLLGNGINGLHILNAENNTIGGEIEKTGNVISGNGENGILIETKNDGDVSGNIVQGNFIGTDLTGKLFAGNTFNGVKIFDGFFNKIGGSLSKNRNIISANGTNGVFITGESSDANEVYGNYIGTNSDGTLPLPNTDDGIVLIDGATGNNIGGIGSGEKNVISGNKGFGIRISGNKNSDLDTKGNIIIGNFIGTNAQGKSASLGNKQEGVIIVDASGNFIGGRTEAEGNIIADNLSGIMILDTKPGDSPNAKDNRIEGNVIGVDAERYESSIKMSSGIIIENASNNFVGGTTSEPGIAPGNLIANNDEYGIRIINTMTVPVDGGNIVEGNIIGYGVGEGRSNGIGVCIDNMNDNTIAKNVIRENKQAGIVVKVAENGEANSNHITENEIFQNFKLGIDLGNDSVTLNDSDDDDTGANGLQNFPEIISVTSSSVSGNIESSPNTSYTIELFYNTVEDDTGFGEGEVYLSSFTLVTNINGDANFFVGDLSIPDGACVTATTTNDLTFDTSEFSKCVSPIDIPPFIVNSTGDAADINPDDGLCDTGNTNSEGLPECTIRAAIQQANASTWPREIRFDIPGAGPHSIQALSSLPIITNPVNINGISQPGFTGSPIIEIDGSNAGIAHGLQITSGASRISGLAINNFEKSGLVLQDYGNNTVIRNFIGTVITGNEDGGNGGAGILIENSGNNNIGTKDSVMLNIIAHNGRDGVLVSSGFRNSIIANSIYSNGGLGINLSGGIEDINGITENDNGDIDTGANTLQNYPELISVTSSDGNITIEGTLNSANDTDYLLAFFSNGEGDSSNFGEGAHFIGSKKVTTDESGNADFSATLPAPFSLEQYITSTATNSADNNTSEFSAWRKAITTGIDISWEFLVQETENIIKVYPNPSSGGVTFHFILEKQSFVLLNIYNSLGQNVNTAIINHLPKGTHNIRWESNNLLNGIYYYTATIGSLTESGKIIIKK